MRLRPAFAVLFWIWAASAAADLYRWVDPETGSVKFSSYPPPWYGNPQMERHAPKVERIPAGRAASPAEAESRTEEAKPAPSLAALEAGRKSLLKLLSALPENEDFDRAAQGLQQQLAAYHAVVAELDRIDPRGAAARKAETRTLLERLREATRTR